MLYKVQFVPHQTNWMGTSKICQCWKGKGELYCKHYIQGNIIYIQKLTLTMFSHAKSWTKKKKKNIWAEKEFFYENLNFTNKSFIFNEGKPFTDKVNENLFFSFLFKISFTLKRTFHLFLGKYSKYFILVNVNVIPFFREASNNCFTLLTFNPIKFLMFDKLLLRQN